MSRLINFLQSDLKEIETSFESIKDVIDYKINYEENSILAKDIERIESFIIYWGHHVESIFCMMSSSPCKEFKRGK